MSKGDNLVGKKTMYKGIEMRSKLESKIAFFLDTLNIKWEYEPKTLLLSNGIMYKPDFYLSDLNTWLEVKGVIEEHNKELSRLFVKDNGAELILLSNKDVLWFSQKDTAGSEDNVLIIGQCSKCNSYFFCCNLGSYHCRKCKYHNGDHDILYSIQSDFYSDDKINFYDTNSIKRGLKRYGISI